MGRLKYVACSPTRLSSNTSAPDVIATFLPEWDTTYAYRAMLPTCVDIGITRAGTASQRGVSKSESVFEDLHSSAEHAGCIEPHASDTQICRHPICRGQHVVSGTADTDLFLC